MEIPDDLLSIMMLNSVAEEYENFSAATDLRDDIPTLEVLKAKLKEKEARPSDQDAKTSNVMIAVRGKNKIKQTTQKTF